MCPPCQRYYVNSTNRALLAIPLAIHIPTLPGPMFTDNIGKESRVGKILSKCIKIQIQIHERLYLLYLLDTLIQILPNPVKSASFL